MGGPTRENEKNDDHLAYAPKWARDSNLERSPGIAEGEFPQHNEQSYLMEDVRDGEAAGSKRLPPLNSPRLRPRQALDPEFLAQPRRTPRNFKRTVAVVSLAILAAAAGAAALVFLIEPSPDEGDQSVSIAPNKVIKSLPLGGIASIPVPTSPASRASNSPQPSTSPVRAPSSGLPGSGMAAVRGVTNTEVRFGMSAPFTGAAKELGNQMKLGLETAFNLANDAGGIDGRQVKLVIADDGYEPSRTADTMKQLFDKQQVFGFVGNVGTPTAVVALPYALQRHALFFGAFTGADLLRREPPDRYVFNYRASYAEETEAVVNYLVKMRHLLPNQIAVFAQHDAFGDAGFAGVAKAIRTLRGDDSGILRLDYERNTVDVDNAIATLRAHKAPIKAIVMVAAYRAAAKFIEKTRDLYPAMIYTNVSFVGSTALANELMLLGPRFANGVIVTQVVPAVDSYSTAILKYRNALAKYFPGEAADYVSLEGYVDGMLLLEGLKRAGQKLDTEGLVDALETVRNFDLGLGTPINFSQSEHQGSHKVWGTQLDDHGRYQPIDLQ